LEQVAQNMDLLAKCERAVLVDDYDALDLSSGFVLTDSNCETITRNGLLPTIHSRAEWLPESE
jgi:hypothetical protein